MPTYIRRSFQVVGLHFPTQIDTSSRLTHSPFSTLRILEVIPCITPDRSDPHVFTRASFLQDGFPSSCLEDQSIQTLGVVSAQVTLYCFRFVNGHDNVWEEDFYSAICRNMPEKSGFRVKLN